MNKKEEEVDISNSLRAHAKMNIARFSLYITHVKGDGPYLKICGHVNKTSPLFVENLIQLKPHQIVADNPNNYICYVKHNNKWYRARLMSVFDYHTQMFKMLFIDYGNTELVHLGNIFIYSRDDYLSNYPAAAAEFYLCGLRSSKDTWALNDIIRLNKFLCNSNYEVNLKSFNPLLISIPYAASNLARYLISEGFGVAITQRRLETNIQNKENCVHLERLIELVKEAAPLYVSGDSSDVAAAGQRSNVSMPLQYVSSGPHLIPQRKLRMNSISHVFVVNVQSFNFVIHLLSDIEQLDSMMCEINEKSHELFDRRVGVGQVCLGRLTSRNVVARAVVSHVNNDRCLLHFVDFGEEETVKYEHIFRMPEELLQIPAFGIKLALMDYDEIQSGDTMYNYFRSLVFGKQFIVRIVGSPGSSLLELGNLCIGHSDVTTQLMLKMSFNMMADWHDDEHLTVVVSHVDSCVKLFVQPASVLDHLNELKEEVRKHCDEAEQLHSVAAGNVCCARSPKDGGWYRAIVLETLEKNVLVTFPDYGHKYELPIDKLCVITAQLLERPVMAKECLLKGFEDLIENKEMTDFVKNATWNKTLKAHVVDTSNGLPVLNLMDESVDPPVDINLDVKTKYENKDVQHGVRKWVPKNRNVSSSIPNPVPFDKDYIEMDIKLDLSYDVYVTWLITPSSFYVQLSSYIEQFSHMMNNIPKKYKGIKPYEGDIPVGATVLAKYPKDNTLYRATVVSHQPHGKYCVQYVDFGNKLVVDCQQIWQLDEQFMTIPKMAIHCSLLGKGEVPSDADWQYSKETDAYFRAKQYQCVFKEITNRVGHHQYHVMLCNNAINVADALAQNVFKKQIDLKILVGQQIVARVTQVESYEKFFVQFDVTKKDQSETVKCRFNNHTAECRERMTLAQLRQLLTGNKFILFINELASSNT